MKKRTTKILELDDCSLDRAVGGCKLVAIDQGKAMNIGSIAKIADDLGGAGGCGSIASIPQLPHGGLTEMFNMIGGHGLPNLDLGSLTDKLGNLGDLTNGLGNIGDLTKGLGNLGDLTNGL